jgi:alkylation response protein AidB-like acyl-CoA dehydrogenase
VDIKFSAEDLAFRDEVREFFTAEFDGTVAEQLNGSQGTDYKAGMIAWQKKLHAKGWIAPGWPTEYGGTGWSATQKFIYETERGLFQT